MIQIIRLIPAPEPLKHFKCVPDCNTPQFPCDPDYCCTENIGPATVKVNCNGVEQTKQISPGSQDTYASTNVGTVTINQNGTITLN